MLKSQPDIDPRTGRLVAVAPESAKGQWDIQEDSVYELPCHITVHESNVIEWQSDADSQSSGKSPPHGRKASNASVALSPPSKTRRPSRIVVGHTSSASGPEESTRKLSVLVSMKDSELVAEYHTASVLKGFDRRQEARRLSHTLQADSQSSAGPSVGPVLYPDVHVSSSDDDDDDDDEPG